MCVDNRITLAYLLNSFPPQPLWLLIVILHESKISTKQDNIGSGIYFIHYENQKTILCVNLSQM